MSRPLRARGSKLCGGQLIAGQGLSRPLRARGSKLRDLIVIVHNGRSRPLRARGSKQVNWRMLRLKSTGRAPCGRVDRNAA